MKWIALSSVLAFAACGERSLASESDAGAAARPAGIDLAVGDLQLTYCSCHHGVGPGIDGSGTLTVDNHSGSDVELGWEGVVFRLERLEPFETRGFLRFFRSPPAGTTYQQLTGELRGRYGHQNPIKLLAGESAHLELRVYLDPPFERPKSRTTADVTLTLTIDGAPRELPYDQKVAYGPFSPPEY